MKLGAFLVVPVMALRASNVDGQVGTTEDLKASRQIQKVALPPPLFDNPQIRVARIRKESRQETAAHFVPALLVIYLNPANLRVTLPDGSAKEESYVAGDFSWWDGGERASQNLGDRAYEFLTIRVKEPIPNKTQSPRQSTLSLSQLRLQSPGMAKLMVFDNDKLRVFKMTKTPREPGKMHEAPGRLLVFLTDGHLRRTYPTGGAEDDVVRAGDVKWWPPGMHASENVGEQDVKFLLIVPKL